jgi:hypothetical protein
LSISNWLENRILDNVLTTSTGAPVTSTSVFASLHTGDPGETGTGNPLASAGRFPVTFNPAASATSSLAAAASVVCSATGTVSHMALWDSSATDTGNCLWYGALAASKTVANVGDTVSLASGALTVNLD